MGKLSRWGQVARQIELIRYMWRTNAPLWVITFYLRHKLSNQLSGDNRVWAKKRAAFRAQAKSLDIDQDWFSRKLPIWLRAFKAVDLDTEAPLTCLEIGSWQGLSAHFMLTTLPKATLTCVDTWEGADEHLDRLRVDQPAMHRIEQSFDRNLAPFADRLTKFRGTSQAFFSEGNAGPKYDLIYVDGSHHAEDVLLDGTKPFEVLKDGGLLIFDDYFWRYYPDATDIPASAIHTFLRQKQHQLELICVDRQVVVRKLESLA